MSVAAAAAVHRTLTSSAWGRRETKGGQQFGARWGPAAQTPIGGRCSSPSRAHHIPHIPRLFKLPTFLGFSLLIRSNCAFTACQFVTLTVREQWDDTIVFVFFWGDD